MKPLANAAHKNKQMTRFAKGVVLSLGLSLIVCIAILASVPPVSRDALTHHLAIPKLYLRYGLFTEFPELVFSYYPMNLDLLYLAALKFGNDIVPKYIHFAFGLFTAAIMFSYLKKRLNYLYASAGSLLFLSVPIIVKLSVSAYVDLGLVFFSTASLLVLFLWKEKGYRLQHLVLAGVCVGLATGTKYNGLISLVLLSAFVPFIYIGSGKNKQSRQFAGVSYAALFFVAALLVCSPWLLRNVLWKGNPFFPLLDTLFNPDNAYQANIVENFAIRRTLYNESFLQIALLPFRIFFEGQDNNPRYFDGILNPFLLILPLLVFCKNTREKMFNYELKVMTVFAVLFIVIAFLKTGIRIRYIAPVVPFLVILSMTGIHSVYEHVGSLGQNYKHRQGLQNLVVSVAFIAAFSLSLGYLVDLFKEIRPIQYISGTVDRDSFITRYYPEYPLIKAANNALTDRDKILAIFLGNRGYYFDIPVKFDLQGQKSFLFEAVRVSDSADGIAQHLYQHGITHLLVRHDLFETWAGNNLSEQELGRLNAFFKTKSVLVKGVQGYSLLRVIKN